MTHLAIRAENIGKRYRVGAVSQRYRTLRETISGAFGRGNAPGRARREQGPSHIWALRDLNLDVAPGEVLGIIGGNGSGKSTLLKILSRITEPTAGTASVRGRVGLLLEVGTGFHNELTGRENIFLSGAILGMRRDEIRRKFDEMVDFAEVSTFIDTPLKHYSSGMYMRLAFAVAAHLEPAILMVDEVLAVGDAAFQAKCLGKLQEVGKTGRTVLFVSHDLTAIARLAPRTILLRQGQLLFDGVTSEAIRQYTAAHVSLGEELAVRKDRAGDGMIRMESLRILDAEGRGITAVRSGDPVTFAVTYRTEIKDIRSEDFALDIRVNDALGHPVTTFSTRFNRCRGVAGRRGTLVCHVPSFALANESYSLDLWLNYRGGTSDGVLRAAELQVVTSDYYETGHQPVSRQFGAALFEHKWVGHPELTGDELSTVVRRYPLN
jgi:lipopolysaccharide transport system ATP-binding protein